MGSEDWYRNTHWGAQMEAAFDAKLARSRSQKAQYLRIQGSILKDSHPAAAIRLLGRCVDEGDPFHVAPALLEMAHAYYVSGEVQRALELLEDAIEQQVREPLSRTSAAYDYAMLVALHERTERYERALAALDAADDPIFSSMVFQAEAARAVIYRSKGEGERARRAAQAALAARTVRTGWIPGHEDVGVVPAGDDRLSRRLRAIAGAEPD
ncbi:hypothetical protein [Sphingosinicella terrae]|uniref:hypothetical protein n=1 Tax=Sphingosinicella terrae TaxID=2172047 RepID=UPI0013B42F33|nr:hypothetical protein [Sphingosinicella terrae]